MNGNPLQRRMREVAPLAGSVDRNNNVSLKSRLHVDVAPLAGSVDRNQYMAKEKTEAECVAPLAGSVDRNKKLCRVSVTSDVAPLAGSVDRNNKDEGTISLLEESLPSRGAWIEII